ncbi:MAG TPA: TadE/TadG family type IV pilus assembly protein [Polyangia bacterium]|nr:TadE/TadG family type IV pilus assembly protein [Polyangia bacterium]
MRSPPVATCRRVGQRGGTTVEFAMVTPILFLLLVGVLDVGRLFISRCMLQYAVVVGARAGLAKVNAVSDVQNATAAAAPMLGLTPGSVSVTTSAASWAARTRGNTVTVSYSGYTFAPAAGSFSRMVTKNLSASSQQTIP